jgi:hypothetical protein
LVGLRILIKKKVFAQKKIDFCLPAFINIYSASIQKALAGNKPGSAFCYITKTIVSV